MIEYKKGVYLATVSAIFIGLSAVIGAQISKQINPIVFASVYLLLSIPFLIILSFIKKEKFRFNKIKNSFSDIMGVVLSRNILGNIFLLTGFSLTTAIRAVFLLGLDPVFVTILGWKFLGEKITKKQIILIISLLIGVFILSTNLDFESLGQKLQIGDLFVILGVFCMSVSYLPSIKAMKKINSIELTTTSNLIGGLILIPIAILIFQGLYTASIDVWKMIFVYVILFGVLSLYTLYSALKHTKPWIVSSLLQLAPIPGVIFAFIWLGDTLSPIQIIGGVIIIISSYLIAKLHKG